MITITVDLTQTDRLFKQLTQVNSPQVSREVGQVGVELVKGTFIAQRSFTGAAWAPLTPATMALRKRRGSSSSLKLIDRGNLFSSIGFKVVANQFIREVRLTAGGPGIDAESHNQGNEDNRIFGKTRAPIPKRAFMPVTEPMPSNWIDRLSTPIDQAFERAIR